MLKLFLVAGQIFRLARQDLKRDWAISTCQVFALVAILTPLLIFQGLRDGVLTQLLDRMNTMPGLLEIEPISEASRVFSPEWLEGARARADVSFVVGNTKWTARSVDLMMAGRAQLDDVHNSKLTPSSPGDPLVAGLTEARVDPNRLPIVLSHRSALDLGARPGDDIDIVVPHGNDEGEAQRVQAAVVAVIPPTRLDADTRWLLLPVSLAQQVERFREGGDVPELGWPGSPEVKGSAGFAGFRMYARTLEDVAPLCAWLESEGIAVRSSLALITPFIQLGRSLTQTLDVITILSTLGFAISLAAIQWASVERKTRELGLLGLIGYGPELLLLLPVIETLALILIGAAISFALFQLAASVINASFPTGAVVPDFMNQFGQFQLGLACRLPLSAYPITLAGACIVGLAGSSLAVSKIIRLDPALIIREA